MDLTIIIPTIGKSKTIERTLLYLNECKVPENLKQTIIVENGPDPIGSDLIKNLKSELNASYTYVQEPNKSNALNLVIKNIDSGLIVFFDDDIRIHSETLMIYSEVASEPYRDFFFAGPLDVDYELDPFPWLLPYLPASAKGWQLGTQQKEFLTPEALGANWAAFVDDLKKMGGFNIRKGPGSGARGQESDMQDRLLKAGKKGLYLPNALVWHYVPSDRCSPEWLLHRATESGRCKRLNLGNRLSYFQFARAFLIFMISTSIVRIADFFRLKPRAGFIWRRRKNVYKEVLGWGKTI